MAKRGRLIAVCLALSCGAPQRPGAPVDAGVAGKPYAPLAFKADAKAPAQAVILGTDAAGGSTLLPLAATATTLTADALEVPLATQKDLRPVIATLALGAAPAAGASTTDSPARAEGVTLEPTAGPAWRAGAWLAAHIAATALGKDLTDLALSVSGGRGDGVSASALTAAGFIAARTGASIDPAVAVLGALLPDGTLGPVPALPELVAAALDHGKRRIGIPAGMRRARSTRTDKLVDVVALAARRGAQVTEVADVQAAYALLTGRALPAPVPVDATAMALDATTRATLDTRYKSWQQRLAAEWGAILQLESAGRLPAPLVHLRESAKRHARAAEQLYKQHLLAAAYQRMVIAAVDARSANQIYDVLTNVQENKLDAALATLDALEATVAQGHTVFDPIAALHPPTLGGHLQMLAAFRAGLRGSLFGEVATRALASTKTYLKSLAGNSPATLGAEQTADAVVAQVGPTVLYIAMAAAETSRASEQLDLANAADVPYTLATADVRGVAASLRSVGGAGVAYVDELLAAPLASSTHISLDEARQRIALLEPGYVIASGTATLDAALPKQLAATWGESSLAWTLLSLAAGELASGEAATLIARYGVLDVQLGDSHEVKRVANEQALARMLEISERTARMHARAARVATGAIPVQARIAYQLAMAERGGTLDDRLDALAQFWSASAWSQTAVMLARN